VRREGNGSPLLFLGGSNTDFRIKAPVFDSQLTAHYAVASYEPRGLGRSDQPHGSWNMADYALDALALLDALGWGAPDIMGESFGAMTALELAIRHPERVKRLALVVGAPGGAGGSSYPIEKLLELSEPSRSIEALKIQDDRYVPDSIDNDTEAAVRLGERLAFNEAFLACQRNALGYPRLLAARAAHDCWERLGEIDASTIVISGRHDRQAPMENGKAMAERMNQASFHVMEGGHGLCFDGPAVVDLILEHWLA